MKGKSLWYLIVVFGLVVSSTVWAGTNFSHLLGLHYGGTTAGGLFYRHYVSSNFSWQVSFYPMYYEEASSYYGPNAPWAYLLFGNMEQFFLHFTRLNTGFMSGRLFLWAGGSVYYKEGEEYVYENDVAQWQRASFLGLNLGGGPGIETVWYEHFVFTLSGGYAVFTRWKSSRFDKLDVNFTAEVSAGYLF